MSTTVWVRAASAAAASLAALGALAPGVAADAVYHTQHMQLAAVGGAPLRSGFVQNIKANGPTIYAHEIYVLKGAAPRSTYTVTNHTASQWEFGGIGYPPAGLFDLSWSVNPFITCPSSGTSGVIAAGETCTIGVAFAPTSSGAAETVPAEGEPAPS